MTRLIFCWPTSTFCCKSYKSMSILRTSRLKGIWKGILGAVAERIREFWNILEKMTGSEMFLSFCKKFSSPIMYYNVTGHIWSFSLMFLFSSTCIIILDTTPKQKIHLVFRRSNTYISFRTCSLPWAFTSYETDEQTDEYMGRCGPVCGCWSHHSW